MISIGVETERSLQLIDVILLAIQESPVGHHRIQAAWRAALLFAGTLQCIRSCCLPFRVTVIHFICSWGSLLAALYSRGAPCVVDSKGGGKSFGRHKFPIRSSPSKIMMVIAIGRAVRMFRVSWVNFIFDLQSVCSISILGRPRANLELPLAFKHWRNLGHLLPNLDPPGTHVRTRKVASAFLCPT